ncbi:carboxypeptidase-like regulatory domain-containing protein [Spirosoma sp.]|uniref:carboxypeptidase-like regulatory domain-containing protein n=1 Tax=Spirosoma sp. TaxID=1899569 RepID=UPI00261C407C|nr:carboxypeptidase-like regulatory domain-containing protein [Spirosoma sp.]MCX6213994.1 carboxypeptidase-like regulatory domain-containing protein [Spirosoma sp.]
MIKRKAAIDCCLLMSFLATTTFAQLTGRVLSKENQRVIPYATIYLRNNAIGAHANENGEFVLDAKGITNDTVYIQSIGYTTLRIALQDAVGTNSFYLSESPITLQATNVRKRKQINSLWKGATEDHKGFIFGQMGGSMLREVALYMPNDEKKEGFLNAAGFYVVRFGKHKTPFRVRVYEPDGDMPGKDLLTENVVIHASGSNRYCTVDLRKFNIPFGENGVFISMEWLNLNDKKYYYDVKYRNSKAVNTFYGQQIGLSNEFEELQGRVRINQGDWKTMTMRYASPMFKVKIDFYED